MPCLFISAPADSKGSSAVHHIYHINLLMTHLLEPGIVNQVKKKVEQNKKIFDLRSTI